MPLPTPATSRYRFIAAGIILSAAVLVPAGLCQFLAKPPRERTIHLEAFRYGKQPAVIRCNRGDRLVFTFAARDTGHSFFLEDFDLDVKITPGSREVVVFRTSDPTAPPQFAEQVEIQAKHPGWLNYLVSKSQYRCHVWCGPMHAFEQGELIIEPNTLLFAGMGLLGGIVVVGLLAARREIRQIASAPPSLPSTEGWDVLRRWPWLRRLMKWRGFQFAWVALSMGLLQVVLLTTLFGTKVAGRNLGIMLTWVVWLFLLTAVLTPLGGRIWCLACPLPLLGEILQRGAVTGVRSGATGDTNNHFFGLNRAWPSWLANDWLRIVAFLLLGTFSTVLVAVPRVSGWVILGMLLLATGMALVWQLRAFCRYLCPVSAFVGLYSRVARLALRPADQAVCDRCPSRCCRHGSPRGWACPYGLCVAEIRENRDCGLCTECIKTCPYDNVTLRWRPFAGEAAIRDSSEAWLAMAMFVLAVAYCVVHLGPWPQLRDCVDIVDRGNWRLFGVYAAVLWTAALVIVPAAMLLLAAIGRRLACVTLPAWRLMTASAGALAPIGLATWIAFVVPMLLVNVTFVVQSLSDPFGWGWDFFGRAGTPWHQLWPGAIPWIQVACIGIGLAYSLRSAWRIWLSLAQGPRAALRGMTPLGLSLIGAAAGLVWFLTN